MCLLVPVMKVTSHHQHLKPQMDTGEEKLSACLKQVVNACKRWTLRSSLFYSALPVLLCSSNLSLDVLLGDHLVLLEDEM